MDDDASARQIIGFIKKKKSAFWEEEQRRRSLALFHDAARRVPAYKDFLKKNKVDSAKIRTFADFTHVPPVGKKEYLQKYPMEKLCWDGTLDRQFVFTATSGSTGKPFYFPRTGRLDWESSIAHQLFLEQGSCDPGEPTLVLVCFGMGVWIGGVLTYKAFEIAAKRGNYPVSILTPGINKDEIFKALTLLAPNYKQVVLAGYPPFIKDIFDEAADRGIDLGALHLRVLFAAEAFNEKFRDHIAAQANMKNICLDTLNVYGTADIGTMAYETPGAILVRRFSMLRRPLFERLFLSIEKTPTLAQYNPFFTSFESVGGEILLTGDNAMPLVRYAIGDHGGVHSFSEVAQAIREEGLDIYKEAAKAKIPLYELPFVYVYERKDLSVKFYGAIIYPEHVKMALQGRKVSGFVSGKFTMMVRSDKQHNQSLEVNVETRQGKMKEKNLRTLVEEAVLAELLKNNAEFRNNYLSIPHKVLPKVILWENGSPEYFRPGIKQRWVIRYT
jgi:phenylacetate-CoA ligase